MGDLCNRNRSVHCILAGRMGSGKHNLAVDQLWRRLPIARLPGVEFF